MINKGNTMFEEILRQQAKALEAMMLNQPANDSRLMDEARSDLQSAIDKAIKASKADES